MYLQLAPFCILSQALLQGLFIDEHEARQARKVNVINVVRAFFIFTPINQIL